MPKKTSPVYEAFLRAFMQDGSFKALTNVYVFEVDGDTSGERIKVRDTKVERLQEVVGNAQAGVARVYAALRKIEKLISYTRVFSTRSSDIKRSDHLDFCWSLVLHEAYEFQEKWKNYNNELRVLMSEDANFGELDVKKRLNLTKSITKNYIRERGEKVHEWAMPRHELMVLQCVEEFGEEFFPHRSDFGNANADDIYRSARNDIIAIIRRMHASLLGLVDFCFRDDRSAILEVGKVLVGHVAELRNAAYSVEESPRSFERGEIWALDAFAR